MPRVLVCCVRLTLPWKYLGISVIPYGTAYRSCSIIWYETSVFASLARRIFDLTVFRQLHHMLYC
jgi:hypothetical protein